MRAARTLCAGLALLLGACAHYPATPPLGHYDPHAGYRFRNLPPTRTNTDSLLVILTFSGGGTRAAALSYGVLKELAATPVPSATPERTLLDEVDVISSVSGGSFTAAYYALHGPEGLEHFERDFLKWNAQGALKHSLLSPGVLLRLLSPGYSRSDLAADRWDQRLFHGATYDTLLRAGRRPLIILNASDMSVGDPFSFTQEQFDPFCGDLSRFRLARAVAASSAFPGLLSPVTLQNHADRCRYVLPQWAENALEDGGEGANPDRYRAARNVLSYRNAATRPYIHLIDGGVADNVGVRAPLRSIGSVNGDWSVQRMINNREVRRLVVIVVNAKTSQRSTIDQKERPPNVLQVLQAVASTPMGNYTRESIARLQETFAELDRDAEVRRAVRQVLEQTCPGASLPGGDLPQVSFHAVEVSFDHLQNPAEREFFENLPTNFSLPARTVDLLRDVGGRLLREAPEFQELLEEMEGGHVPAAVGSGPEVPAHCAALP